MTKKYNKGFFEFIAAADAEKVHSQTIGWIFSKDCDVFENHEKSSILNELLFTGNNEEIDFTPTKVDVEINDIDILITCGDKLIIIENKIKSSQHSNQLFKYEYLTAKNETEAKECYLKWKHFDYYDQFLANQVDVNLEFEFEKLKNEGLSTNDFKWGLDSHGKKPYYIYLTLIEEEPIGTKNKWKKASYYKLYDVMSKYLYKKEGLNTENYWILKSYVRTIENLSFATNSFINTPIDFEFVFTVGKQTKNNIKDIRIETAESYIKALQLETLMQKWFYSKLIDDLKKYNPDLFKIIKCHIGETHGTALVDFNFNKISIANYEYSPILQFQGNAIKFALYGSRKNEEIKKIEKDKIVEIRNDRKLNFAKRLSTNIEFLELIKLNQILNVEDKIKKIYSKISTPKNADGFISINLNENEKKYWQFEKSKELFVLDIIQKAHLIFESLND